MSDILWKRISTTCCQVVGPDYCWHGVVQCPEVTLLWNIDLIVWLKFRVGQEETDSVHCSVSCKIMCLVMGQCVSVMVQQVQ